MNLADELRELRELYKHGDITKEEFDRAESAILAKLVKSTSLFVAGRLLLVIGAIAFLGFLVNFFKGKEDLNNPDTVGPLVLVIAMMVLGAVLIGWHYKKP
jgi:hypothetical protein